MRPRCYLSSSLAEGLLGSGIRALDSVIRVVTDGDCSRSRRLGSMRYCHYAFVQSDPGDKRHCGVMTHSAVWRA